MGDRTTEDSLSIAALSRSGPRRRGPQLHGAILEATLAELAESGYQGLTMDKVAQRARTGKASLYRRWSGRAELVADALRHALPTPEDVPDTGDLREDVLVLFRRAAQLLAGPLGEVARGLLIESLASPELHLLFRFGQLGVSAEPMLEILRRAVVRGQARPQSLVPLVADAGPALIRQHFLLRGSPIPDELIIAIVDDVVLPLTNGVGRDTGQTHRLNP